MQHSRSLMAAAIAACAALLAQPAECSAAQSSHAGNGSVRPAGDGWRAVRRTETTELETADITASPSAGITAELNRSATELDRWIWHFSAQSPDYDLIPGPPTGPIWAYPSRRPALSVPVPGFAGEVDAPQQSARTDWLALQPFARRPVSTDTPPPQCASPAPYGNQSYAYQPPAYQAPAYQPQSPPYQSPAYQSPAYGPPPALPSFHAAPFDRAGPTCPVQPNPCAPCQTNPFEDPCQMVGDGGYRYSWDNIYFFAAYESFRLAHEHTRLAARFGLNWGLPVFDDYSGLGFQIGFSGSLAEQGPQWFATTGLFYRGDMRQESAWNVGAVFDWMRDDEIGAEVGQLRAMTSITLDRRNEIGIWGAMSVMDDNDKFGHKAESVDQANVFYRHLFDSGWDITAWVGWRSPEDSTAIGGTWYTPLNDYWAWVSGGFYAFEGDSWNLYSALIRHWGNRARQDYLGQDRHMPYFPVADNTSMTLFHKP